MTPTPAQPHSNDRTSDDWRKVVDAGVCRWPEGACLCAQAEATKPDPYGRVWMHCEQGLTLTKASMSRFVMFCLLNNVEIGQLVPFAPEYRGSQVSASVRIRPDTVAAFERVTGGKLRRPPRVKLNGNTLDRPACVDQKDL